MPTEPQTVAVLDMGTNTFKLSVFRLGGTLIEEVTSDNRVMRIARLIDDSGTLPESGVKAIVDAVADLAAVAEAHGADTFIAVATQGLRTAQNGDMVIARINGETPWNLRLISGGEEAALTFEGLVDVLPETGEALIVDIGGGSTEIVYVVDRQVVVSESHRVGSGVLTDRHVREDPPTAAELEAASAEALLLLSGTDIPFTASLDVMLLAGGAGQFLDMIAREELAAPLGTATIEQLKSVLLCLPANSIAEMVGIPISRAQVIPAGHRIASACFDMYRPRDVRSAPSGIRRGLVKRWVAIQP